MTDLEGRLANRVQLTTDGHRPYLQAVNLTFGQGVDYAMLHKIYGARVEDQRWYSPPVCVGTEAKFITGDPRPREDLDELRRAPEPHHADGHAPLHALDQRLLKEG
jgi:hypothetical protein